MTLIITLALCLSTSFSSPLLKNTSDAAQYFHQKCLQALPLHTANPNALAALLCGEKITDFSLQKKLSETSLIHIFIVSGSHLILLDQVLGILKIPFLVRFGFLLLYSLCVGWQAPAVRALVGLLVHPTLRYFSFFFPKDLQVMIVGLITLFLFPSWWNSTSLLMSWCAALALSLPSLGRIRSSWQSALLAQFAVFFFMCAPLWGLGSLHPLSILYNFLIAPVVAYGLLPLAFLGLVSSFCLSAFDGVMQVFSSALMFFSDPIEIHKSPQPSQAFLWTWVFTGHALFHFLRIKLWQGKDTP